MQLKHIADALKLELRGDGSRSIENLAPVHNATEADLTFVVSRRYLEKLQQTQAGAVIVPAALAADAPCSVLISEHPYLSYAQVSQLLYPEHTSALGVAGSAVVDPTATLGEGVSIGEHSVIEAGAVIGDHSRIGPGCHIGRQARVGQHSQLLGRVTLSHSCEIGDNCRLQPGVVIGADGFGYAPGPDGWVAIRQVGRVMIGHQVQIGANTTIDRGALEDTVIGDGVILDNQIQIAHNVRIGKMTAIAACVGIAGSTIIGERCTIGGKAAIVGHIQIADDVHLTATSFVTRSVLEAGSYSSGMPLQKTSVWRRTFARLNRLEQLARSIKKLSVD